MLVLSRKIGERILIGEGISITVVRISQGGVRLGIHAPAGVSVVREELRLPDVGPDDADVACDTPAPVHS